MNKIRIFVASNDAALPMNVFYSQRSQGPLYCWQYQKEESYWRVERLHAVDSFRQHLCLARWKALPQALQVRLREHYVD